MLEGSSFFMCHIVYVFVTLHVHTVVTTHCNNLKRVITAACSQAAVVSETEQTSLHACQCASSSLPHYRYTGPWPSLLEQMETRTSCLTPLDLQACLTECAPALAFLHSGRPDAFMSPVKSCFQTCTELWRSSGLSPEGLHVWTQMSDWEPPHFRLSLASPLVSLLRVNRD